MKLTLGELVHETVNKTTSLGLTDQLTEFCRLEIKVSVPGELLPFGLSNDVGRNSLELTKGRHGAPHSLLHHLTEGESFVREGSPTSFETNLKDRTKNSTGRLGDVNHVGHESETFEFELRNVGLKEDVDLGGRVVDSLLDRDWYSF